MKYPNFNEEKKLWRKGYKWVAGLDESGRGSLAGPVIACVVLVLPISNFKFLISKSRYHRGLSTKSEQILNSKCQMSKIKDSKKLTVKQREEFYKMLTSHSQIKWAIGKVSEKVIDKINILEATKLAMERAIRNLKGKIQKTKGKMQNAKSKTDYLILDGNFKINTNILQKSIIKADEKVFSCAAASVIAKVSRDRMMLREHKKYPQYGFAKNKGYGTKFHLNTLKKYGPSIIHRLTFNPIKKRYNNNRSL